MSCTHIKYFNILAVSLFERASTIQTIGIKGQSIHYRRVWPLNGREPKHCGSNKLPIRV